MLLSIKRGLALALAAVGLPLSMAASASPSTSVFLEDLTWTELRDRITAGKTTVLLPIGGTEQSGPHIALGKHNQRVRVLAGRIAEKLGNAVVAPVVAYVPEGAITLPTGHMRWPGTISIPAPVFEETLQAAVRSFRQHGLCHVVLLGDHGDYRASLNKVAAALNRAPGPCRVHALPEYYRAASADYPRALAAKGFSAAEIGTHAGLADTSLTLAVDAALVRQELLSAPAGAAVGGSSGVGSGVAGDPRRATAELGRAGLDHIVEASVAAIHAATR